MRGERLCGPHATRPLKERGTYGPSRETGRWYFTNAFDRDDWIAERLGVDID